MTVDAHSGRCCGRCVDSARRAVSVGQSARRESRTRRIGSFPAAKWKPASRSPTALARELHEELGIDIGTAYPWVVRVFDYPHALVRLHFFRVFEWSGEIHAREHQSFGFFSTGDLPDGPLLPATIPLLRWLALPPHYAISAVARLGRDTFLRRLESALARGLKLLQFREPELDSRCSSGDSSMTCALGCALPGRRCWLTAGITMHSGTKPMVCI